MWNPGVPAGRAGDRKAADRVGDCGDNCRPGKASEKASVVRWVVFRLGVPTWNAVWNEVEQSGTDADVACIFGVFFRFSFHGRRRVSPSLPP